MPPSAKTLSGLQDMGDLGSSRSGRVLQSIRRDSDIKGRLFRDRRRNEEILSLAYQDGTALGGDIEWRNVRENSLNLPYRWVRWFESQATSKKMIVKVNRDAGAGQRPGGPADNETGMWQGITLGRIAQEGGFRREMNNLIAEWAPRGTSVMKIGYHEESITREESQEAGKDPQSVIVDVAQGDLEAKPGQAHLEISKGLGVMAEDDNVLKQVGTEGIAAILARKSAHDEADYRDEIDESPKTSTRLIRRKIYMRQLRVGTDVGWAPFVFDTEDTPLWWERHTWTVAEVKASDLFKPAFKGLVEGYDARTISGVFQSGETPDVDNMDQDSRAAQTEDVLDEDERIVEWFEVWYRRPDMKAGGFRKIVAPEAPDMFVEADDSNPFVDDDGYGLIPGFYPYYDFTPIKSSLPVPARTTGIPPIAVGMTQFEKIAEYNRLRQEAALKGATRIYQLHPALKGEKGLIDALNNGEIGYAYVAPDGLVETTGTGKMLDGINTYSFTGTNPEIDREAAREEADWVKVMGMPPAVLQGMGTAETLGQDRQGIAAGERESGALVSYFEERMADVMGGIRGLMRGNLDDEDFIRLLGQEGAAVMKAWQDGSVDDGDEIEVTFGARALAQEAVEKKQLMEAIGLEKGEVEPLSGVGLYDTAPLFEELHRRLDVGPPKKNEGPMLQLQQMVMKLASMVEEATGVNPLTGEGDEKQNGKAKPGGPSKSEGSGPSEQNIDAGAKRGTNAPPTPAGV